MKTELLRSLLVDYRDEWPDESDCVDRFEEFVRREPGCFERQTREGHITGSAWIVDPDGTQVLLMHHRKLDRWLQPGGHADGDSDPRAVALREAVEETGLEQLVAEYRVLDLDIHAIPARGREPEHLHYDLRFRMVAPDPGAVSGNHESRALRWFPVGEICQWPELSLARMARKERDRG